MHIEIGKGRSENRFEFQILEECSTKNVLHCSSGSADCSRYLLHTFSRGELKTAFMLLENIQEGNLNISRSGINRTSGAGRTILHYLIHWDQFDLFHVVIRNFGDGFNIANRDNTGRTIFACLCERVRIRGEVLADDENIPDCDKVDANVLLYVAGKFLHQMTADLANEGLEQLLDQCHSASSQS